MVNEKVTLAMESLAEAIKALEKEQKTLENKKIALQELELFSRYDTDEINNFFKKPYVILPRGKKEEWYLIVPKFFELNIGFLLKSTDSYNVFVVNKYSNYLDIIPKEFQEIFKFKPKLPLKTLKKNIKQKDQIILLTDIFLEECKRNG